MTYKVTSDRKVCGVRPGEAITENDIITAGGNVKLLLSSGAISKVVEPKAKAIKEETQEQPQVQKEEPKAFVYNQYEGDK
jgi:hypothetical protein